MLITSLAGLAIAAPFIGLPLLTAGKLLVTLSLAFLTGLSLVFLLSTIYVHSPRALLALFIAVLAAVIISDRVLNVAWFLLFPPLGSTMPQPCPSSPLPSSSSSCPPPSRSGS
jgi:hypothetical protein